MNAPGLFARRAQLAARVHTITHLKRQTAMCQCISADQVAAISTLTTTTQ